MDPQVIPYVVAGGWGFFGSLVYGSFRLRTILCNGEEDATPQQSKRAWGEFLTALLTGTVLATGLSDPLLTMVPSLNSVGCSLVIGLLSSHMMPGVLDIAEEAAKKRARALLSPLSAVTGKKKEDS